MTRIAQDEKIRYHKLTDKVLSVDAEEIENEMPVDAQAPKGLIDFHSLFFFVGHMLNFAGNLLHLPSHSSIEEQSTKSSTDDQRAMKQLEISTKIQTGLELKIEAMRKEIRKFNENEDRKLFIGFFFFSQEHLTDELQSTQKTARTTNEQLNETKKRLRDTQHDLKELEDKYKRYSDALYRLRSESRSTFDHLTHVLGIREKQSSQTRKLDDETKKSSKTTTNETEANVKTENTPTTATTNEEPMENSESNPPNDQSV